GDHSRSFLRGSSQLLQGRIEKTETCIAVLVVPLRLDPPAYAHAARHRVLGVGERASPHAREERGAECRALLRFCELERQAKRGGDDAKPELAARAAAGGAADLRLRAELVQELERVAQAEC